MGRDNDSGNVGRIGAACAVGLALLAAAGAAGRGQEPKGGAPKGDEPKAVAPKREVVSGVILKVEPARPEGEAKGRGKQKDAETGRVLTINAAAVWRDWARDQAQAKDDGPPRRDAAKGEKSVATTGQPAEPNNVVRVIVDRSTRVGTRFRSPDDESSRGENRPEAVEKAAPDAGKRGAVAFGADDLRAGLFVEAEFGRAEGRPADRATTVTVIRPVLPAARTPRPADRSK